MDTHYVGYKHKHIFKRALQASFFPQWPFNTLGFTAKILCSSFFKSSELGFPDFTPDVGLMRIHLPGNGLKGEKQILSCQIGCKAKMLGFPGGCQGPHLPAHTQQESWLASQLEGRRNSPPQLASLHGFQQRHTPFPGVVLPLGD